MNAVVRFWREEEGATAMEYGLILGLAGAVAYLGIYAFYDSLQGLFSNWGSWFDAPSAGVSPNQGAGS